MVYRSPITRPIARVYCTFKSLVLRDGRLKREGRGIEGRQGRILNNGVHSDRQARVVGWDKRGKVEGLRVRFVGLWIMSSRFNFFWRVSWRNGVPAII